MHIPLPFIHCLSICLDLSQQQQKTLKAFFHSIASPHTSHYSHKPNRSYSSRLMHPMLHPQKKTHYHILLGIWFSSFTPLMYYTFFGDIDAVLSIVSATICFTGRSNAAALCSVSSHTHTPTLSLSLSSSCALHQTMYVADSSGTQPTSSNSSLRSSSIKTTNQSTAITD